MDVAFLAASMIVVLLCKVTLSPSVTTAPGSPLLAVEADRVAGMTATKAGMRMAAPSGAPPGDVAVVQRDDVASGASVLVVASTKVAAICVAAPGFGTGAGRDKRKTPF